MKALKWLLILLIGLPLLIFVVAAGILATTDLNRFKPDIESLVSEQLDRKLTIDGDIGHTLFPWLGVSLGSMTLANAEGFGDEPFARIGSAEASIKILPLLSGQITIGNVNLSGVTVNAQVDADGNDNFPVVATASSETEETAAPSDGSGLPAIQVEGISLTDADIRYRDATSELDAHATAVNLTLGSVQDGETSSIEGGLNLTVQPMDLTAAVALNAELTPTFSAMQFVLDALSLEIDASGAAVPGGARVLTLSGNANADLNAGTATLSGFSFATGDAVANVDVDITGLNGEPEIAGKLDIPTLNLAQLLDNLDLSAGPMQREDALNAFALNAELRYAGDTAALEKLVITLDDTRLDGTATLSELSAELPAVTFDLAVDAINVDHYSPPLSDAAESTDTATESAAEPDTSDTPIPLPIETMRALRLDGRAQVSSLTAANLAMQDISVELKAADGDIAVSSLRGLLYEGEIDAKAGVNVSGEQPRYSATATLGGIKAQPLLTDFAEFDKLIGSGLINLDIATAGDTVNQLTAALGGSASFSFLDGAIDGINIAAQLRKVLAAIGQAEADDNDAPKRTDFAKFSASARIENGVVTNTDLDLRSPLLRLAGDGTVDLPGEAVDYTLQPALVSSLEGQGGATGKDLKGLKFDLPIVGTFDELANDFPGVLRRSITDGASSAAKAKLDAAKEELKAKQEEAKAKAKAELDAKKEEAKAELEEKAKEKTEEVKDKLKDKLKKLF